MTIDKSDLIRRRGFVCEICLTNPATELHHCIVRRRKGHPEYDVEENLECLCHECHQTKADGYEHSRYFWHKQVQRGYDMQAWYDSLNLKAKEYFGE